MAMTKVPIKDGVVSSPYPPIELPRDESFYQYVRRRFLERPHQPALVRSGERLRFADVLSLMERYANGFRRHGVSCGSRVCVNVSNSAESFVAAYSLCCLGAAVVLVKPSLPEREVLHLVEDSQVGYILTEQQNAGKILNVHRKYKFKTLFSIDHAQGFVCVRDFEEENGEFQEPQIEDTRNHITLYIYTSGTTGLPKGVEVSVFAYNTSVELCRAAKLFEEGDVVLAWNPVPHISGFVFCMAAFICGATVVPSQSGLSPKEFVDIINTHKVTSLCAFPTAFRQLVFQLKEGLVPSLKRIVMCGTNSTEDLYQRTLKVFQLESLRNGYGMSEGFGFLTMTPTNTIGYRSAGVALPLVEYKIIDNTTGQHLGPGEVGEIIFRSPHVMRGYHNRPDATAQVLDEQGWCSSGDAGYYDSYGNLYIAERIKDMIKCMDQQVAPAEIETILNQHPLVREAAVVGIDHPELGEAPTAFVVVEPSARGQVSEEELVQLVAEQMVFYKNLHGGVIFVDHIPTTDTGKYQRNKLRQEHSCHLKKQCSNT